MSLVRVLGPAAWNTMLVLDELPEPRPQMVVARDSWDTVGGTSAGKALHLHDLGLEVRLMTPLGPDEYGRRILDLLPVTVDVLATARTERHVNLMAGGARVSVYATPPATATPPDPGTLRDASAVVLDLAPWTRDLAVGLERGALPVWTDLHDVGEDSAWHEPFWRAATVVQCSRENLSDPAAFLHHLVGEGVSLAVCTLGGDGALAVDATHREHRAPGPRVEVVDTNGAGDAHLAGLMAATLAGQDVARALLAGAQQAARALATRHIGPGLRTRG